MAGRPSEPLLALLRDVARKKGVNTASLARSIGVERAHLKQVLSGREPLTVDELIGIASALELGPEQLGGMPMAGAADSSAADAADAADADGAAAGDTAEDADDQPDAPDVPADGGSPSLAMVGEFGRGDPQADPIGHAADPYGNHAAQIMRLGLALGCDLHLLVETTDIQDSGVPPQVLAQFRDRLPLRLDAAFHRHHDVRFLPEAVQITLSFDALYTCRFPWASIQQVTLFPLPPDDEPEPEEDTEDEPSPAVRRGHLRLVE